MDGRVETGHDEFGTSHEGLDLTRHARHAVKLAQTS
jgi:hypothetical protein